MNIDALRYRALPVLAVLVAALLLWYLLAIALNAPGAIDRTLAAAGDWGWRDLLRSTLNMSRPVLPTPHQIAADIWTSLTKWPPTSPRNLLLHTWVTASAALSGFVMGVAFGLLLAICIVHSRTLDKALLPWIVASQTVPVLAIAPIVLIILGSLGITGLLPKAAIAMYLCFFPVTIATVQGLRSPQKLEMELVHTYAASRIDTFWMVRLPSALPYLFPAFRVAIASGLVGTMVAELPTGAQAGLGARLLTGSYYGNTVQIWSALVMASLLGLLLTALVSLTEYGVMKRRKGGR
ncbi:MULTISPECIES: ABC transporter permease [Brenneria]|uniref:ABC transporter permease n=1 Tax=Brenneria nigrifluens DSM 30175 = ATCC 13028 TaxID=1121120 RepID=A0A2U1ULK2_9GAMM|nr:MULTISPECIES: ABC transporter permease [Brenneria]EHD19530.1 ABC-type transporter, integral membrane subunit [Brenneria sp. EniD312]PWC22555.1 ABC transporter permease [Brenneria nigrifluens] [Brenneria nigrifluens DSM 30175 = ATCC 13028]QCR02803.1 ABC transporter permease [Brenneria nigrifluens] [Brenneria nigrifluens DSM 30175 = ATCC 13028]